MGAEIIFIAMVILTVASIVTGVTLIKKGKALGIDNDNGYKKIKAGWLVLGIYSAFMTAGMVYLCIAVPFILLLLIFLLPFIILLGVVLTATFGIYYLVEGYKKDNHDSKKIRIGMTLLIINAAIILTFGTLIILFMGGVIPIRLM